MTASTRRRAGAACLLAGLVAGLSAGSAWAATAPSATTPAPAPPGASAPQAPRPPAHAASAPQTVPGSFSGDVQAVAVRVEADEPLPAGSGDIPSLTGSINSDENVAAATAAVGLLGPVTGPKLADPTGDGHQYAQDPQATCGYPSPPNSDSQSYPLEGQDQQTAQSETTCSAGPSATGLAYSAQIGGGAGVTNPNELQTLGLSALPLGIQGAAEGHEALGPDQQNGSVRVSADAAVTGFEIPGMLRVASVEASGWTTASGRPGGAATSAQVAVSDLAIGGATISLDRAGVSVDGSPEVPASSARDAVAKFNDAAASSGCNLTLLSNPATYPQAPLFQRPPLPDRVNPDGTDAGSTAAGFLVRCVVPDDLNPTDFKPLILQILFGFVGTEAHATSQGVQFGIGYTGPSGPGATTAGGSTGYQSGQTPLSVGAQGGSSQPPSPAPSIAATGPRGSSAAATPTVVVTRSLLPVRAGLEAAGFGMALLLLAAGLVLLAPWRVALAPAGHPEA